MRKGICKMYHYGGGFAPASPVSELVCAIYERCWRDIEDYPAYSWEFETAAEFLLLDSFEMFTDAQKKELKTKIEARRKRPLVY